MIRKSLDQLPIISSPSRDADQKMLVGALSLQELSNKMYRLADEGNDLSMGLKKFRPEVKVYLFRTMVSGGNFVLPNSWATTVPRHIVVDRKFWERCL